MDCSQVLPGAVNPGPCSVATGYYCDNPFIVYASGKDVVIVDGHLTHIQTVQGDVAIRALHCSEGTGKIAVAWETDVVIFNPEPHEESSEASSADLSAPVTTVFPGEWRVYHTLHLKHPVDSLCWNRQGTQLLVGGKIISLWTLELPPQVLAAEVLPEREMGDMGEGMMGGPSGMGMWNEVWRCEVAIPVIHLKFSPDSTLFATAGENDRLVKLWYQPTPLSSSSSSSSSAGSTSCSLGSSKMFSFTYIAHPRAVTGFVWRRTSPCMPKGCVANVVLTYCKDNICRLWSHSLSGEHKNHFRFYIVASIDPVADIPFRTTMPLNNLPFVVHWLNNKETIFTSKANKYQRGTFTPVSHHSSIQSFTGLNDEVLQSWVCIDETGDGRQITTSLMPNDIAALSTAASEPGARMQEMHSFASDVHHLSPGTAATRGGGGAVGGASGTGGSSGGGGGVSGPASSPVRPGSATQEGRVSVAQKRAYAHLMAEWNTSPDLLLCIHPSVGSLMVWTVEGLDAPAHASRLVHISFSSCLPHIFPPHLAQTLRQELLQFLIREQDAIHPRASSEGGTDSLSLPVPQIRLSSGGSMATMSHLQGSEDVPKVRPESTLILVSSHVNGSLNTWSVELTEQSNSSTSIAGLIHCAGTGGHHSIVRAICRHPWLPILITVSSSKAASRSPLNREKSREDTGEAESHDTKDGDTSGGEIEDVVDVKSELIIWNSDLPGPLKHKSRLNELSRMLSHDADAFRYVAWAPPISVGGLKEDAFARCPSSGLFVANIGSRLCLFQTSLYSITKPQPTFFMNDAMASSSGTAAQGSTAAGAPSRSQSGINPTSELTITSQLGKEGISLVSVIEPDLSKFDQIVGLHTFRMCSLVTSFEVKKSLDSKFCKDIVVILIENKLPPGAPPPDPNQATSPGPKSTNTLLHMWQVTVCAEVKEGGSSPIKTNWDSMPSRQESGSSSIYMQQVVYTASVKKVYSSALPIPVGCHVVQSSPACDISSSLQLQLPTLSSPFLFSTACSDGTIRCWQFSLKYLKSSSDLSAQEEEAAAPVNGDKDASCECTCHDSEENLEFELFEVFGASSQGRRFDPMLSSSNCLDCREEDTIKSLPTQSFIPSAITNAYPGRFAMAHLLTKPVTSLATVKESPRRSSSYQGFARRVSVSGFMKEANPFNRYAVVSIWECESSGGLKWACETTLLLSGPAEFTSSQSANRFMGVHMEWLPMENGAYLLACCFASTIFVFGMALPTNEDQFASTKKLQNRFTMNQKVATLQKSKARASWVCLLQFPFSKLSVSQTVSHFAYTGSNSLLLSCGRQMHLYSCWVRASHLSALFTSSKGFIVDNSNELLREVTPASASEGSQLPSDPDSCINLLDYAHICNTPLSQHHPKILIELMNSGHLHAVNVILVNLVKYLLLYCEKKLAKGNYFDEGGFEAYYGEESTQKEQGKRRRLLSVTEDGQLRRSQHLESKVLVESIPQVPLSKLKILKSKSELASEANEDAVLSEDDADDAFLMTSATGLDGMTYKFGEEEENTPELCFSDLGPETPKFTPDMAERLSTLLENMQLSDLTDVEQVRLLAIAETVANTKLSFGAGKGSKSKPYADSEAGPSAMNFGVGYASVSLSHGVKGGEAMDDCGLRYLLALENYISLSKSLPSTVSAGHLMPSDIIWAFHSDAEAELLAALPCVQKDELNWKDLKDAGIGWWVRSSDLLRRLIEKLAKAQFMQKQEPLDAALFYLAMKKQTLMKGLFKTVSNNKMMTFFGNNFSSERWKKAALKNAFVLLGMQRFEHAAAFFLLAGKLWDAVEVCVSRLEDLQLALVITRLYEGDNGDIYQRLLKEYVLGISAGTSQSRLEASSDPFLRSMAHWLLQDYPASLETFLQHPESSNKQQNSRILAAASDDEENSHVLNPAIFNFYYYLRSHPVLIRRDYASQKISLHSEEGSKKSLLSGVGEEPLTPPERNLLFGTAYYHLSHGCPLLALNVLSKLPKDCDLGLEVAAASDKRASSRKGKSAANDINTKLTVIKENMIQSGTLGDDFSFGAKDAETEEPDWSKPISSKLDDDVDWSKPVSSMYSYPRGGGGRFGEEENEFDWSKPVSSTKLELNDGELSPPHFSSSSEEGSETQLENGIGNRRSGGKSKKTKTLSSRGIFILSLGEQLQYNACLSILTEELNTIVIPACCSYLWLKKGPRYLPLLPLKKPGREKQSLTAQFQNDAFEKTVLQLRGDLVQWLKEETQAVKDICGFDKSGEEDEESASSKDGSDTNLAVVQVTGDDTFKNDSAERYTAPAGYDLLTTLMNYTALHAATSPSLLTVKLELMHLMNSLLPWSTGFQPGVIIQEPEGSLSQSITDFDASGSSGTSYAVDPAQLPILTSSSLPVRHLTNLALHLRLMSGSIVDVLIQHSHPPISSQPLSSVDRIFELCCAISHCLKVCLSPIRFSEFTAAGATLGGTGPSPSSISQPLASPSATSLGTFSPGVTPTSSGVWSEPHQQLTQVDGSKLSVPRGSPSPRFARRKEVGDSADQTLNKPNTKPSKWPGIAKWPSKLSSDEGKDPTPLSLVLVECLVSVYLGLFSVAWSRHSIEDIYILLRNFPSGDMWYSAFGGGIIVKKAEDEKSKRSKSLMQRVEAMTKRFKLIRKASIETEGEGTSPGLFVAPSKSLLYHYLSEPSEEEDKKGKRFSRVASEDAREFCVVDDEGEETEKEDEEWEDEDDQDEYYMQGEAPMFRIGAIRSESVDHDHDPNNPNCFAWCLMNLCISKILQSSIRKILNTAGLEVLELVTASPLLYSTLKLMEQWELTFIRRLEALGPAPDDLFGDEEEAESPMFRNGPPIMRHKSILEQDHTPFNRSKTKSARRAKHLWTYLASLEEVRETFIHYIFSDKPPPPSAASTSTPTLSSLDEEGGGGERTPSTPSVHPLSQHHHHETVIIVHKEVDSIVSSFCVNSCSRANATQLAIALPREVLEIEIPDSSFLESNLPYGDSQPASGTTSPKRSLSLAKMFTPSEEEFVMVPHTASTPTQGGILKRPQSAIFQPFLGASRPPPAVNLHRQTGSNSSMMLKRLNFGVKRMAQHPSLAYYLTGSMDGSVVMWEFGTPHHVSVQRSPGTGASVTKIRFTPEGNKYGVTDSSGKLSLWQGIHTYTQSPYQMLTSGMKSLSDFLFLGSSSLIAACGDGNDNRNLILWDTLMPTSKGIVRDFMCHDGGATSLGYSRSRQRLICGGRRGEVCIFDIRQYSLLQVLQVHSSSVNCIAVNDIDGYFVTGAADGEIKVIDSSTLDEIAIYPMMHTKSRLFRHSETGVTGLDILPGGKLFSCGVDGTVKCRTVAL